MEALTNTANLHGLLTGQSTGDMAVSHLAWMVMNWKLEVYKRVKVCETFWAHTWAQVYNKYFASRDFDIWNEQGELVARATSTWMAVNLEKRALAKLTPEIMDPYGCEPEHQNFPGFQFPKGNRLDVPVSRQMDYVIPKSMIDCNNHVHNPAYLDLAAEVMPVGMDRTLFNHVMIFYKKEILPGQTVHLEYGEENGHHWVQIRDPQDNSIHAWVECE